MPPSGGPLPQTLEYLITDIGRRYGVITVTAGLCVLHSNQDPALLHQICSDRSLKQLGLQLIAPSEALDLDELAKEFGLDIERMLEPIFGRPVEREANEKSARQRAREMARTLQSVPTGVR